MNLGDIIKPNFILDLLQCLALIVLWLRRPGEDAKAGLDALTSRIAVLEERIEHMPDHQEFGELQGSVQAVQATLAGLAESQGVMRGSLSRIESWLINNRG
jgi:hypothetical protein